MGDNPISSGDAPAETAEGIGRKAENQNTEESFLAFFGTPFHSFLVVETSQKVYAVNNIWLPSSNPRVLRAHSITDGSPVLEWPIDQVVKIEIAETEKL